MTFAFVFPGQGSQSVGMMQGFGDLAVIRDTFAEASAVLGYDSAALCFEGPAERLNLTENTQPALLVSSIAALRTLDSVELKPLAVAGHSLGEYSALYAAGVLSEAETLQAVKRRGQLMHREAEKHPGTMAAVVGLPIVRVVELLSPVVGRGYFALANYNTPEQLVISGARVRVQWNVHLPSSGKSRSWIVPKSRTLMKRAPSGRSLRKRFAGLMSRWTMPSAWASARASEACTVKSIAVSISRLPLSRRCFARSSRRRVSTWMRRSPWSASIRSTG